MSFSSTLSIANSGLAAAQSRAQTAATNIANANTDGYVRRSVQVAERNLVGNSVGVQVLGEKRAGDYFLTADRMRFAAENAFASERAATASEISRALGEPGADTGLFAAYARFETALRDAAATPESSILQRAVVDTARDITSEFRTLSDKSLSARTAADRDIGAGVDAVNTALGRLETLNALPSFDVTPEVLDERQRLVDQINEFIPVKAQTSGRTLNLVTDGGVFLLTEKASFVDFDAAGTVGRGQSLGAPLSGLSVNGVDITPTGTAPQRTTGGRLAALFDTRDVTLPSFDTTIDALAFDLVTRFADDTVDPTKTAGENGLFTLDTNAPPLAGDIGLAATIRVSAAVDPQQGGDARRVRDGLGTAAAGPSGNGAQLNRFVDALTAPGNAPTGSGVARLLSSSELVAAVNADAAFAVSKTAERALFSAARLDVATDAELAATGVDTDQELQQLLLIEQAYAANARVIQTVTDLLDELMRIV